jgi:hypothetical protein
MLNKLSKAADELQAQQPPKASLLSELRHAGRWLVDHVPALALVIATCGAIAFGSAWIGYHVGESKADAYRLLNEVDLKTTAQFARQATVDLGFASARLADALKGAKSQNDLLEVNAKLDAKNKELLRRNAELVRETEAANAERDRLQAALDRSQRADQTKK